MADRQVKAILTVDYQGETAVLKAQQDLRQVDDAAKQAGDGLDKTSSGFGRVGTAAVAVAGGIVAAQAAFQGLSAAAGAAIDQIERGAALEAAQQRFENLAASIGTTADALETDLAAATDGLVSRAEMIAGASELMSLGLAKSHEEAVALSEVSGKLNWDMQVLGLTLANQSTMRLDALGLSMESVTSRVEAFTAAGMAADEAFKLAVIEAGREKIEILGDASETAAGKIQALEASGQNLKDTFSTLAFTLFEAAGGVEAVAGAAGALNLVNDAMDKLDQYRDADLPVWRLLDAIARGNWAGAALEMEKLDRQIVVATANREYENVTWEGYAFAVQNGLVVTRQMADATQDADAAMLNHAAAAREARQALEAYGETSYTAALAQTGTVDLAAIDRQIALRNAAAEAVGRYADAVAALTAQGGDYFTQYADADAAFDFAQALYNTADAAGAGIGPLSELGTSLGLFPESVADAATAAAQAQTVMDTIAQAAADGRLPWEDYATAVQNALDVLNGVSGAAAGVALPVIGDRARQLADFELDGTVPQAQPMELEIQLRTDVIEEAVTTARGIVEGFTNPADAYEAIVTMDVSDVETKAGLVKTLLGEIPQSKELTIHVSATGMHILEELRAVGAIP